MSLVLKHQLPLYTISCPESATFCVALVYVHTYTGKTRNRALPKCIKYKVTYVAKKPVLNIYTHVKNDMTVYSKPCVTGPARQIANVISSNHRAGWCWD